MKNLLIVGAGGLGRTVWDFAQHSVGFKTDFILKGFLDNHLDALDNFPGYPKVITGEDDYEIKPDDFFVVALGNNTVKRKITEKLLSRGAQFYTLIHKSAIISPTAHIGNGCIVFTNSVIGSNVIIGNHTLIQDQVIIGHDSIIGEYNRIDCQVMMVGGTHIGNNVILHTKAMINHNVTVCDNSKIGACSFVIRNVKENIIVAGNPARELAY